MPPAIQTRDATPTEWPSWRRTGPGTRKMPEPMTDPIMRRIKSRRRRVLTSWAMLSVLLQGLRGGFDLREDPVEVFSIKEAAVDDDGANLLCVVDVVQRISG